jgi:autotransporter family porin
LEPVAPTPVANITPGFWFRGVGAYIERDDEEDGFTLDREQTVWGGMAGFDFGHESASSAWLFGLFAGYLTSDLEFDATNTEWNYEGPTVGAYVTYLDHGFHADLTVKADFLDIDIDPEDLAPAADDADTDAVNIGGRFDAGYKFGETWFIEPQAALAVVHTEIDDVDIFGGTVEFDDETSVRGRLGLRLGVDHANSTGTVYSADVIGSVWEDFSGDNDVTIVDAGVPDFGASVDPGQTIGDVSLGFSVADPEGWSGFVRGNYLFASDYEAITGNAGVRYAW